MNTITKRICGTLAPLGLVATVATTSRASSQSAFLGQPQNPAAYSCFTNNGGTVENRCSTEQRFCMALPVNSPSHTIEVDVLQTAEGAIVGCFAAAVNPNGTGAAGTAEFFVGDTFGTSVMLQLGTLTVPNQGALFVCCDATTGGVINTVNY
jgi:hypothetical protein